MHGTLKNVFLPFILIITAFSLSAESALYVTADIQGSLFGNECICGEDTAGLLALGHILEQRDMQSTFYIDAGGLPYPGLDDPLLLKYLDKALNLLGVDSIVRNDTMPDSGGKAFVLRKGGMTVAIAVGEEHSSLKNSNANLRIWILRGNLNTHTSPPAYIDLVILTGPESPGHGIQGSGGVKGISSSAVPWMSLAPNGNGLGIIRFSSSDPPEIEIIKLEYGISPESPAIAELGEQYLADLAAGLSE